jgi:alpha-glucoside transport system substrate-binding protein
MTHRFHVHAVAALGALALVAAGCGSSNDTGNKSSGSSGGGTKTVAGDENISGKLSVVGIWTGDEQKSFQAVVDAFHAKFPKVTVKYNPAGDNVPTVLATAVQGGHPPDLATIAQPGLIQEPTTRPIS